MPTTATEDVTTQDEVSEKDFIKLGISGKDRLVDIACKQLAASSSFKRQRIEQWRKIDEMYNGKIKKRLRQMFQVPLPIFSGMIDTLAASYDEPIEIEFHKKHPADYFKARKTQSMWDQEKASTSKNGRWDYKSRIDKKTNIRYGRSVMKYFAESDPKYKSVLQNTNPYYFHCQPMGGGQLENHLFCGEENVFKSEFEIKKGVDDGIYDKDQYKKLKMRSKSKDYMDTLGDDYETKMARFSSLGMQPDRDSYVGEPRYNLVEWCLTYRGTRWYLLFDPWTKTWLRVDKLKEIYSKDLYPWTSWASHEDDLVFWSIGFGDILYPVADSAITLFNQELTAREKKNFKPRAYDKDMVPNVGQLDRAQYRPDALVEIDTKGGSRDITKAVFTLDNGDIEGTIELIDWIRTSTGRDTGITDTAQGAAVAPQKKVTVAYMEQAGVAKRIGYKSQSYTECWGEIGVRFVQGLKDHMSKDQYIEVLGEDGIEPDVLTREDLYTKNDLGVRVISSTAQKADNEIKKQGRIKGYELLAQSQNINSEMRDAGVMRDVMGMTESEIRRWFDTHNYASKDSIGKAQIAIQELLDGAEPALNFSADIPFLKEIQTYAIEHRNKLGPKLFDGFMKYFNAHVKIGQANEISNAKGRGQLNARRQMANAPLPRSQGQAPAGQPNRPAAPVGGGQPEKVQ